MSSRLSGERRAYGSAMDSSSRLGYMPALDGLRAVAIVLVVGCHAVPAFHFGMLGVDVFFVLSGFLITSLIAGPVRAGSFSRRQFYARRAIRLVPALVVMVAVLAPVGAIVTGDPMVWVSALAALLYFSPLVPMGLFTHTWTLAIEEWFYLLWPVVLAKFNRDQLTLRQCAILTGSAGVAVQATMLAGPGSIAARPSALLIGVALSLWWLDGGRVAHPTRAVAMGVAAILTSALAGPMLYGPLPFWLAITGAVAVVGGVACGGTLRVLTAGPMVAIGVVSYEWYLLHDPMLKLAHHAWGSGSYWLVVPVSLALAFGLHYALVPLQTRLRARLDRKPVLVVRLGVEAHKR